jgi:hypothetical protein
VAEGKDILYQRHLKSGETDFLKFVSKNRSFKNYISALPVLKKYKQIKRERKERRI